MLIISIHIPQDVFSAYEKEPQSKPKYFNNAEKTGTNHESNHSTKGSWKWQKICENRFYSQRTYALFSCTYIVLHTDSL